LKEMIFKDPRIWLDDINPLIREDERQIKKWGVQEASPFEWMTYLAEEVGELAAAVSEFIYRDGDQRQISKEAIQVATLALKIAKMAEGYKE